MAFDKAKVLKAAEKFLSQGKINAAIKEYRQIVDNDADDLTTLNMLGDLYVRSGKKEEAVSCFERIAEHYSAQEFNLKAIAMYKKIERIRTRDPIIALKLAELYAAQSLVVIDSRSRVYRDANSRRRFCNRRERRCLEITARRAKTRVRFCLIPGACVRGRSRVANSRSKCTLARRSEFVIASPGRARRSITHHGPPGLRTRHGRDEVALDRVGLSRQRHASPAFDSPSTRFRSRSADAADLALADGNVLVEYRVGRKEIRGFKRY